MIEFNLNVLGPRAQTSVPDALRYPPGLSIDWHALVEGARRLEEEK